MKPLLYKLLNIDVQMQQHLHEARMYFVEAWASWLAALVVIGVLLWVGICYYRDGRQPSFPFKSFLIVLRLVAFVVLMFVLFQPMLRVRQVNTVSATVAVLVDNSVSMSVRDRGNRGTRLDVARDLLRGRPQGQRAGTEAPPLLSRLQAKNRVRLYTVNADARLIDQLTTLPIDPSHGATTQLGTGLERALNDLTGQPVSGVVMLTDGGNNMGTDPVSVARRAGQLKIPVFTVGIGDATPTRDVALTDVLADDTVRVNDTVTVSVGVTQRGYAGREIPVTLTRDGAVVRQERVRLGADKTKQEVAFTFTPDKVGQFTFQISAPTQAGESTDRNNRRAFNLRVVDKQLKVLYIEGEPRWEYRYLKNAILRDKRIELSCLLTTADLKQGGEGNKPIYSFPADRRALFAYDILVLGDVPRSFLTDAQLRDIQRFVEERGGSLLVIVGDKHLPWEYRHTPLADVFPVVFSDAREEVNSDDEFRLELTTDGKLNPTMLLADTPDESAKIWEKLPGVFWCAAAQRTKPGATVLAVHPERKLPLMVVQPFGSGKCFMSLTDSTWRWRYRVGDKHFYRFWGQVVRSLIPHELPSDNRFAKVGTDRTRYRVGERVVIRARLLDGNFFPVKDKETTATVKREGSAPLTVRLERTPASPGTFSGEFLVERDGKYVVSIASPANPNAKAVAHFTAESSSLELDEPQLNEPLLKQIATVSGGRYLTLRDAHTLPALIKSKPLEVVRQFESDLWSAPLPLLLFALLLTTEWVLRKRKGLL